MGETVQQDKRSSGFWHTVPGLITAVAALLTALGGFLGVLVQTGVLRFGGEDGSGTGPSGAAATGDAERSVRPGGTAPAAPGPTPLAADPVPWERATADLVRRDGTTTRVKAPTVGLSCDTETLTFENGQRVALETVRSIRFDAVYLDSASADGVVTLLDGRELTDPIDTWNCPVTGQNELGSVQVELEDIRRIDFHR
ncbi:hypothetical protein E7744_04625 [Citricoccus sp. SGAir0253]|uniref:hypothetical protein n=1 Tax=Citricoccus sp. SGAir0253 TaxID=2567881 RepID=UPI0010CD395D|nr:hypothetical protein [Citricoccus sp. SGAir0253]QCU77582.1 hypothetical protein E7744_04625 [Citricoccus sp. SGAir0253]